jgi:hypothetical protein
METKSKITIIICLQKISKCARNIENCDTYEEYENDKTTYVGTAVRIVTCAFGFFNMC